jgi:translation initiation factor IF-2
MLVQRGTLEVGDNVVAGPEWGRVRAMVDYRGERLQEAIPGDPVEILGFDGVPTRARRSAWSPATARPGAWPTSAPRA